MWLPPTVSLRRECNHAGIRGNVDIRGTVTAGSNTFTVADDWSNSGTFTANTSTIIFNSSNAATFTPGASTTYKNITINKTSQTDVVTVSTDALTLALIERAHPNQRHP